MSLAIRSETWAMSEIPFLLFLLHRGAGVVVDHPALALGGAREQHLLDHAGQRGRLALDRAGERVAAEGAKAHVLGHRHFAASRRAPPKATSKPCWSSACFRPSVFQMSVCTAEPWVKGLMPRANASGFWCTSSSRPSDSTMRSRKAYISRNFQVVSTCSSL